MKKVENARRWLVDGTVVIACVSCFHLVLWAAPPDPPAGSTYAPVEDLATQLDHYAEALRKALETPTEEYSESKQKTVRKHADAIAVLALVIGNHDQDHDLKAAAGSMVATAAKLAQVAEDHAAAVAEMKKLDAALGGKEDAAASSSLEWRKVAQLENLMKQTQFLYSRLKRGVKGSKLEKQADKTAAYSATLAAIAHATTWDTSPVDNEADKQKWYDFCAQMREAAAQVNRAIHQKDQAAVAAGMKELKVSCDACHAVFEEEQL
ncbi:MAG: hypothetical protein WBF93_20420 [Pirellulales bacterium]